VTRPCHWCAGRCWVPSDVDQFTPVDCPACRGVGRVPGLDPELIALAVHYAGRATGLLLRIAAVATLAALLGCPLPGVAVVGIVAGLSAR
jgi:hypothetical protein